VSAAWLANTPTKTALQTQPTIIAVTPPIPTPVPTAIPTPIVTNANSVSANGVTMMPNQFNVQNDCQPNDQGFSCIVTLALSQDANNAVSWSASVNGVESSLDLHRGTLQPGDQQQINVSLFDTCPIEASLKVTIGRHRMPKIPLYCNG
jgi:hypothetical protein